MTDPILPERSTGDGVRKDEQRSVMRAAAVTRRTGRTVAAATARATRGGYRGVRRATDAGGAGPSGLGRTLELHMVSTFADTLIVLALADTVFFSVPVDEARGRVALSLLVTMAPFVLLAPLLGPILDRLRHGRRYALATTLVTRAFLAWVMAGAVSGGQEGFALYPAAFGFLLCQKSYLVVRASAVPRVLPPSLTLVAANSRASMAGVAAMAAAAPVGLGLTAIAGPEWTLRVAFAVFAVGTGVALTLSDRVDSGGDQTEARISTDSEPDGRPRSHSIGPAVVLGLRSNAAFRAFSGFLTLYLAFLLRDDPLPGYGVTTVIGILAVAAGVGSAIGIGLGSLLRKVRPESVVVGVLVALVLASGVAVVGYGIVAVAAVALAAGLAQSLGKLALDALIQREVPEDVRTSAFARSETVLQLSFVIGGGLGLVLPLPGPWGLGVVAAALAGAAILVGRQRLALR